VEKKTVRVRLDGEHYEDVVCRELTAEEDWKILESCRRRVPDQKNPGRFIEEYDEKRLIAERYSVMTSGKIPPEKIWDLPRRDRIVLGLAWNELNEVSQDEKSRPVGSDSGRPPTQQGSSSGAAGDDVEGVASRDEGSSPVGG